MFFLLYLLLVTFSHPSSSFAPATLPFLLLRTSLCFALSFFHPSYTFALAALPFLSLRTSPCIRPHFSHVFF
ncbi:hypothetical protein GLYMA_19G184850v4 [Glycine max]|nr:hypothetical protein GLYMA_19G184850v4 [Glycine max]KAH1078496.1 hypothetical protein GYH30_053485 [Glycine max]